MLASLSNFHYTHSAVRFQIAHTPPRSVHTHVVPVISVEIERVPTPTRACCSRELHNGKFSLTIQYSRRCTDAPETVLPRHRRELVVRHVRVVGVRHLRWVRTAELAGVAPGQVRVPEPRGDEPRAVQSHPRTPARTPARPHAATERPGRVEGDEVAAAVAVMAA
jgi:hypothetical protein